MGGGGGAKGRKIFFATAASKELGFQCNVPLQFPNYFELLFGFTAWFYITGFHLCFQFQEILILGVRGVLLLETGCPVVVPDARALIYL